MLENVSKITVKKLNVKIVQNFLNNTVQNVQKCLWHYKKIPGRIYYDKTVTPKVLSTFLCLLRKRALPIYLTCFWKSQTKAFRFILFSHP